jgi:hypothetical protein
MKAFVNIKTWMSVGKRLRKSFVYSGDDAKNQEVISIMAIAISIDIVFLNVVSANAMRKQAPASVPIVRYVTLPLPVGRRSFPNWRKMISAAMIISSHTVFFEGRKKPFFSSHGISVR